MRSFLVEKIRKFLFRALGMPPGLSSLDEYLAARERSLPGTQGAELEELRLRVKFLDYEIKRLNEADRMRLLHHPQQAGEDIRKTRASFDYQWREMPEGKGLPSDQVFMEGVEDTLCQFTDRPKDWFQGKRVADVGCGLGRFTYGLLKMGARVSSFDQSAGGLARVRDLCGDQAENLHTEQIDLLAWDQEGDFELVYCYGVVHHTGNTYLAMRNVAKKVAPGGRLFLMIYAYPEQLVGYQEVTSYEDLKWEMRNMDFAQKKDYLIKRFGPELAHGWFDAVSPIINDRLTWQEIVEFLATLGFGNFKRTSDNRNHHLVADRIA